MRCPPFEKLRTQLDRLYKDEKPPAMRVSRGGNSTSHNDESCVCNFSLRDFNMDVTLWEKFQVMEISVEVFRIPQNKKNAGTARLDDTESSEQEAMTAENSKQLASLKTRVSNLNAKIQHDHNRQFVLAVRDNKNVLLLRQTPMVFLDQSELLPFKAIMEELMEAAQSARVSLLTPTRTAASMFLPAPPPSSPRRPRSQRRLNSPNSSPLISGLRKTNSLRKLFLRSAKSEGDVNHTRKGRSGKGALAA